MCVELLQCGAVRVGASMRGLLLLGLARKFRGSAVHRQSAVHKKYAE